MSLVGAAIAPINSTSRGATTGNNSLISALGSPAARGNTTSTNWISSTNWAHFASNVPLASNNIEPPSKTNSS